VVSDRESDRFSVRATVEPRGYSVLLADNVPAGMEIIGRQRGRIAIVVVDTALPHSQQFLQAARSHCPRAHLISLNGSRRAGDVSALLINTGVD
jgi:DNA-binding NtrC family response regulator